VVISVITALSILTAVALWQRQIAIANEARAELEKRKAVQRLAESLLSEGGNAALKSEWAEARQLFLESFESFVASGADPSPATVNLWNAAWHSDPPVWILPGSSQLILVDWIGESRLLALDDEGLVRFWNLRDVPSKERELQLPVNHISGADRQGDLLVLATLTGKMLAYNLRMNQTVWELERSFKCLSARFSVDGRRAAFLEANGTVVLVDTASGKVVTEASGFEGALYLATRSDGWAISEMQNFLGWSLLEGTTLRRVNRLKPPAYAIPLGFHEGHRFIATSSLGRIDFWDKTTLSPVFSESFDDGWNGLGGALPGQDYFLFFSGGKVRLCSEEGPRFVGVYDTGYPLVSATATALHPNRQWIAAGRRDIQIFRIGRTLESRVVSEPLAGAHALAASPDGKSVAIGHKEGDSPVLSVFDIETHRLRWRQYISQEVKSLAFSEDGSFIAVFVSDGQSKLTDDGDWEYEATVAQIESWDARDGNLETSASVLGKVRAVKAMQYLTSNHVVLGDSKGTILKCYLPTGECSEADTVVPRGVSAIALSKEADLLLVASDERSVVALGMDLVMRYRLDLPMNLYVVSDVVFSRDGSLAYATSGPQLFMWDARTGENVWSFHDPDAGSVKKICVLGDRVLTLGTVFAIWETKRGRISHIIADYKDAGSIWDFVVSRDCLRILGLQFLPNGNDQRLILWDAQRGDQYAKFMRDIEIVNSGKSNLSLRSATHWYAFRGLSGLADSLKENSSTATGRSD
jgi:WD40 repeat protein